MKEFWLTDITGRRFKITDETALVQIEIWASLVPDEDWKEDDEMVKEYIKERWGRKT